MFFDGDVPLLRWSSPAETISTRLWAERDTHSSLYPVFLALICGGGNENLIEVASIKFKGPLSDLQLLSVLHWCLLPSWRRSL
jgi:hypothetical protein